MNYRFLFAAIFFLLSSQIDGWADEKNMNERLAHAWSLFNAAKETNLDNDYILAFDAFRPLAEEGNAEAQETIGRMYGLGLGVELDLCQDVYWTDKAARAGRPWAQHSMGWAYWNGGGVVRNHELAYLWFMTAARNGRAEAANDADVLAQSDLRGTRQVVALNEKLWTWRPEDQPPARIIRLPNIFGINWLFRLGGLSPCHFQP